MLNNKKQGNKNKQRRSSSYLEWPELFFLEVRNDICTRITLLGLYSDGGITYCPRGKPRHFLMYLNPNTSSWGARYSSY